MTNEVTPDSDPDAVIAAALADLTANVAPEKVADRLRAIETKVDAPSLIRARWLRARAIAFNRLGFRSEALGDLHEARRLIEESGDRAKLADVFREIAVVHSWRADGREAALALVRAIAEGATAGDRTPMALAMIEAGRLQMEIGRPREAEPLIAAALEFGGGAISPLERQRASVSRLQALVACGATKQARDYLAAIEPLLAGASLRLRFLIEIERARIARAADEVGAAGAALEKAESLLPEGPDTFERIELAEAKAELALAERRPADAEILLRDVIKRYATDALAGREVAAHLLQARALDALGRTDEADAALAAALRRAVVRGLTGRADEVRSRIAERAGVEGAWLPGEAPVGPRAADAAQRFVRRRKLGSGGFGSVERAYDLELGIDVALKKSSLAGVYDTALRKRLLDAARTEVAAASRIEHPGVARIYGMLVAGDGDALLIEEMVEGPTLRTAARKPLDVGQKLDIIARIAYALAAVHAAGIVHRDIKPDNVILRGETSPVLVDFGIAFIQSKRGAEARGGTRAYMAPEQARGRRVDARADLYALGVLAHELLLKDMPKRPAAHPLLALLTPWYGGNIREKLIAAGVDGESAELIRMMLAPHRFWRPHSAAAVGKRLAGAAGRI